MTKRDPKFEDYFRSLKEKRNLNYVEKVGLQDTTLKLSNTQETEIDIKELFVFSINDVLLLNYKFKQTSSIIYEKLYENLKNLVNCSRFLFKSEKNMNFLKISVINLKIVMLICSPLILCGLFSEESSTYTIKIYLVHLMTSFLNFTGTALIDLIQIYNDEPKIDSRKTLDFNSKKSMKIKIFENFYVKCLTSHFSRVLNHITKKEQMYLTYIKFKNMYILELSSQQIIFDLMGIRQEKMKKYYKNEKLWQEILYHSNTLMNSYINEIGSMIYDPNELNLRFVKLECTSTYPRLTYIIKFLPIFKGMTIIHIYSQNKLSRNPDSGNNNTTDNPILKGYREIDILYGSDVKENPNIEFRYTEPKKLQEIENFFTEFFISNNVAIDLYCQPNHQLKYFDYTMLTYFDDLIKSRSSFTSSFDLVQRASQKLLDQYKVLNIKDNKTITIQSPTIIYFKNNFLYDLFNERLTALDRTINKINKSDNTLSLSKIEEKVVRDASKIQDEEDGLCNASHSVIKKCGSQNSQTLDVILKDFVKRSSFGSDYNLKGKTSSKNHIPLLSSNKESIFDIRSNKAIKNFDSKKNVWEKSLVSELMNNDKFSENVRDKSILKIKENLEGEEDSINNNTQNCLLAEEKKPKSLFLRSTFKEFKEDEYVAKHFN